MVIPLRICVIPTIRTYTRNMENVFGFLNINIQSNLLIFNAQVSFTNIKNINSPKGNYTAASLINLNNKFHENIVRRC